MLLADLDFNGMAALVTAVAFGLALLAGKIVELYLLVKERNARAADALIAQAATKEAKEAATKAAAAAVAVKTTLSDHTMDLDKKLENLKTVVEGTQSTVDITHGLVNNAMLVQLGVSRDALRELANLKQTPASAAAADKAEKLYKEHKDKQETVQLGREPC